jgi:DNA modification methylase
MNLTGCSLAQYVAISAMFNLNSNFPLRDKGASNALSHDKLSRHRWYFVKEGFSPTLVDQAVKTEGVQKGELLFDPFSGSGTVPLAGALAGLRAHAFEVNPFLHFLSVTKLRQASASAFRKTTKNILRAAERSIKSPLEGFSTFTEGNRWGRWLFPTNVLRSFEAGRSAVANEDKSHQNFLNLALVGAAMDCCNAIRDGKCLRYLHDWESHEATPSAFRRRFETRAEEIAIDLDSSPINPKLSQVAVGDARSLISGSNREKFRLCVTSPPYLNSFDYSDVYRPELFLGKFVASTKALMDLRLRTIRSHVQANWVEPTNDEFGFLYRDCITAIRDRADSLWSPRISSMVQAYFEDMDVILRGLRQQALDKASVWLVVSTSAYAGVEIPVDLILAEIAQRAGWFLREVGVLRHLRSSSQHVSHVEDIARKSVPLRESVVILDASKRSYPRSSKLS